LNYPVMLIIKGKKCLVAGGGRVAERKIKRLLKSGARVRVVSPCLTNTLARELKLKGAFTYEKRLFRPDDLGGVFLIIAATDEKKINNEICSLASKRGILCNSVNTRRAATFMNMAETKVKGLTIAVSSGGKNVRKAKEMTLNIKKGSKKNGQIVGSVVQP